MTGLVIVLILVCSINIKLKLDETERLGPHENLFDLSIPIEQISNKANAAAMGFSSVQDALSDVLQAGYDVGFYVQSVDGNRILSYNCDEQFYSASAIKGPYVLAIVSTGENGAPYGMKDTIVDVVEWSDNDAYWDLKNTFGVTTINSWLEDAGSEERLGWSEGSYVDISPKQLAVLWQQAWPFISKKSDNQQWLQTLFSDPLNSVIAQIDADETWSKPGWILYASTESGDDSNTVIEKYSSTIDAGIVERENSAYIIAIMTDKGEDFDVLAELAKAIDSYVSVIPDDDLISLDRESAR